MAENQKVRLSLDLSSQANNVLDELATQQSTTKADILRKAIELISVSMAAKQKGQRLALLDNDKNVISEIIGL
jgi:predicted transcriptional regulator